MKKMTNELATGGIIAGGSSKWIIGTPDCALPNIDYSGFTEKFIEALTRDTDKDAKDNE